MKKEGGLDIMDMKRGKKFCHGCGEQVETFIIERGIDPATRRVIEVESCIYCGMEVAELPIRNVASLKSVLVADDSSMTREILKDLLVEDRFAASVECLEHGASFITSFTKMAVRGTPPSMVVLDVAMPVLNGVNAAISLRAIEKALNLQPTPIMFYTSHKCDDNFKKVLAYCTPALYLNKAASSTPDELSSRIERIIHHLIGVEQRAATA